MAANAHIYVTAFKRNCPGLRMMKVEEEELYRLFHECIKEVRSEQQEQHDG